MVLVPQTVWLNANRQTYTHPGATHRFLKPECQLIIRRPGFIEQAKVRAGQEQVLMEAER